MAPQRRDTGQTVLKHEVFVNVAEGVPAFVRMVEAERTQGKTDVDMCLQHVTQIPKRPSEVAAVHIPTELEDVILKCLAKAPGDRYQSATALAEALAEVPPARDWGVTHARAWWRDFRTAPEPVAKRDTETLTITVDLEQRSSDSPPS